MLFKIKTLALIAALLASSLATCVVSGTQDSRRFFDDAISIIPNSIEFVSNAISKTAALFDSPTKEATTTITKIAAAAVVKKNLDYESDKIIDLNSSNNVASDNDNLITADQCKQQQEFDCEKQDPDAKRNIVELIESRGFKAEQHDVQTRDGYIISIQRIVNPLISEDKRPSLKPAILQHGLFSSGADWVINTVDVQPVDPFSGDKPSSKPVNSLGFYLANEGYDVWLATIRGNTYGMRHVNMSSWDPRFWAFTFDEHIKYDLPAVIAFVQQKTKHQKIAYVGHSQGTLMSFGLLSDYPEYANILEPVIQIAPVAYVDNAISPAKYFAIYTPVAQHVNMWFSTSNVAVRYLTPIVCGPKIVRKDICSNLLFLTVGFDMDELDIDRLSAYINHTPAGTSVKNVAHYGQLIISRKFRHFDHGLTGNMLVYGKTRPPNYDLKRIRSNSIALFTAENDWLASPKDVARLKAELTVKPVLDFNATIIKPKWNHIDFLYGKSCGKVINEPIVELMAKYKPQIIDSSTY